MLSIRHQRDFRAPWHSFVFWVWVVGFVGSFAASDLFHAPGCSEQSILRAAEHEKPALETASPSPLQPEIECAACAFQHASIAVFVVCVWSLSAPVTRVFWLPAINRRPIFGFHYDSARGPPLLPLL